VAVFRAVGDLHRLAHALCNLGTAATGQADWSFARATLEECVALAKREGDLSLVSIAFGSLAGLETKLKNYAESAAFLAEALALARDAGNRIEIAILLEELAHVASCMTPRADSARFWGTAGQLRTALGAPLSQIERASCDLRIRDARAALGDDVAFDLAWRSGAASPWETVVSEAIEAARTR
jgi:hypothetical protein